MIHQLEMAVWLAVASLGFAILFNVPKRTLIVIAILSALGGSCKLILMNFDVNIVIATFFGAMIIGLLSIPAAHNKHAPPLVFSIPAVIPMVPGFFAYRAMLGFIKLTENIDTVAYDIALNQTVSNGIKAAFILLALTAGVSFPMLISRQNSVKNMKLK